jgi:GNAT superfamily N-acetyltransferase
MYEVRRASGGDTETILGMIARFCEIDQHPFDRNRVGRGLLPLLRDDTHGQLWLVSDGRTGVAHGYAVVTWGWSLESGGREALLDEIYTEPQGAGAGAALLRHVLAEAAKAGAARLFLETEAHNARARGFYARHGFTREDSIWMCADLS